MNKWIIDEPTLLHIMSVAIGAAYVSVEDASKRLGVTAPILQAATRDASEQCKCRQLGDWKGFHHPLCDGADSLQSFSVWLNENRDKDVSAVFHDIVARVKDMQAATRDPQPTGWLPTAENINALPEPIRAYIMGLETNADPAGMVRENAILRYDNAEFESRLAATSDAPQGGLTDDATQADLWRYAKQLAKNQGYSTVEAAIKAAPANPMQAHPSIARAITQEERACRAEDALINLVNQIRKSNPVDDHGHDLKMNRAYIEASKLLDSSDANPIQASQDIRGGNDRHFYELLNAYESAVRELQATPQALVHLQEKKDTARLTLIKAFENRIAPTADDAKPVGEAVDLHEVIHMARQSWQHQWTYTVEDIIAATAQTPKEVAVDTERGKWALAYLESEGWTVQGIDRQIAIDRAIVASAPKGDGNA
jgi:hypothetical protein